MPIMLLVRESVPGIGVVRSRSVSEKRTIYGHPGVA